jgi:hypothetical protein
MMVSSECQQHEMSPCYQGHINSNEKEKRQHIMKCNQMQSMNLNTTEDKEWGRQQIECILR